MRTRWILLVFAFIGLLGLLRGLWQTRYERVPGVRTVTLEDLRKQAPVVDGIEWLDSADGTVAVRVHAGRGTTAVAATYELPFSFPVDLMHVRLRMKSEDLQRGKEIWEDGRVMIEWHAPDGSRRLGLDPIGSVYGTTVLDDRPMVIGSQTKPGRAALRLENLGTSGSFVLSGFEGIVVRERMSWIFGKWVLLAGFGLWFYSVIRSWPGVSGVRAITGVIVCCIIATQLVVPGPWKSQRPMGEEFSLGGFQPDASLTNREALPAMVLGSGPARPEGRIKNQGSWILLVKLAFEAARPVLHALLLFGPSLVLLLLLGRGPVLFLMTLTVVSIEAAQFSFGYGFDATDILDLANDAIGVGFALLVHSWMLRWWKFIPRMDPGVALPKS